MRSKARLIAGLKIPNPCHAFFINCQIYQHIGSFCNHENASKDKDRQEPIVSIRGEASNDDRGCATERPRSLASSSIGATKISKRRDVIV